MGQTSLHRVAEERSRAMHGLIAARLPSEPSLLAKARARVASWRIDGSIAAPVRRPVVGAALGPDR